MRFLPLLFALFLSACSSEDLLQRLSRPDERALVERSIADVRAGQWTALEQRSPSLRRASPQLREAIRRQMPAAGAPHLLGVRWKSESSTGLRVAEYVYGIDDRARHALAVATVSRKGSEPPQLDGMRIVPSEIPTASLNRFRLADAGVGGAIVLLLQLAALAVTGAALWAVWRSGQFERRWLWSLGCLVGVGAIGAPWAGSSLTFSPLVVQLFSASAFKAGPLAPWVLKVSVPIVAIVALLRAGELRRMQTES